MPALDGNTANIIGWAAVIGAALFLGRTGIGILRMASRIDRVLPVLLQIGDDFYTNGKPSLLKRVEGIEKQNSDILEQLEIIKETGAVKK